jgi:hypothetical protein
MNAVTEGWQHSAPLPAALRLPMQELLARLVKHSREQPVRQLMLIGAAGRVGTSFVAGHWASQLAAFGTVLLIEVRNEPDPTPPSGDKLAELATRHGVVRVRWSERYCLSQLKPGSLLPASLKGYRLVLWDLPPVTVSPTGLLLARQVDGILLLAQAHRTRRHVALHSVQRLQDSGGRLLGVVLNRTLNFIPNWLYRLL